MWLYNNNPVDIDLFKQNNIIGFVYLITDLHNNKKYIGKKLVNFTKKLPPLKGKSRKRLVVVESDWMDYYGSSEEVKQIVEQFGPSRFKREILHLCKTKGEMSYLEAKEQFNREVLLSDEYYNEFIGVKIHSKHVSNLKNDCTRN